MSTEKTNVQHLRDIIETINPSPKKYEEAMEFLDAIEKEQSEFTDTIDEKDKEITENESKIDELETMIESDEGLEEIDCGYGKIWYKTDNLKLQMYMESLTERLETIGV